MEVKDAKGPCPGVSLKDDETAEGIGPFLFIQKKKGVKLTQDPLLLAEFALPISNNETVVDLGTGGGIIPLVLAWKSEAKKIVGVEVEEGAAALAGRNVEANRLGGRVEIVHRDIRELASIYPEGAFSVVVSNPPYMRANSGRVSPHPERAMARSEIRGGLADFISAARHLAGKEGRVCFIFPASRLFEMLKEARKAGLYARRLRFIHTSPHKAAKLFMIEFGMKNEGLRIEERVGLY